MPGQGDWVIVAYRTVQGRPVPVYAELGEVVGPGAVAGVSSTAANRDPSATPTAPPLGQAAASTSPDTAPQAATAAAAPRSQQTAAPLSLEPPKPPTIVREGDPASPIERVLAEHRALLGEQSRVEGERHAAVLRDLLAEHRQALAAEGERHRAELAQVHAQHQAEMREGSARIEGDRAAMAELRERLAEQLAASAEQNACLGDMIATLVETVSRLALSRTSPPAPTFVPPPLRVATAAADDPDITDSASPAEGRAKLQAAPVPASSPAAVAATRPAPSPARAMPEPSTTPLGPTAPTRTAPPASPPNTPTSASSPGAPGTRAGHGSLLAVVMEMDPVPAPAPARPTPRQLRAEEEERQRRRMYEAIGDDADDDEDIADEPEVLEAPRA